VGELIRPLVSVHRLVLLLPDVYRLLDPSVHSVAFSVDDLGRIPIYDVVEGDSMICDLFCSPASDLLVLRVYALASLERLLADVPEVVLYLKRLFLINFII